MNNDFVYFYGGPFSQWVTSPFTICDQQYVNCEQWMMHQKAILFRDTATAREILNTTDPATIKRLGRSVKNFNDVGWMTVAYDYVVAGNIEKFHQNPRLHTHLLNTVGKVLVEASLYDTRWGIGLSAEDPRAANVSSWRGANLLGQAITEARVVLTNEPITEIMRTHVAAFREIEL